MLSGATRGRGGPALARHLADVRGQNESTRPGTSRGLVSSGIADQVRELTDVAAHARSRRPLYHVHADPAHRWSEPEWDAYWQDVESEFRLDGTAFAEAIHIKGGREHRHRVYSLVRPDGTCIRLDHDYARREKVSRLAEIRTGEALTRGRHNKAVILALDAAGHGAAATLTAAGLDRGDRPAAPSPTARLQEARTGVSRAGVASDALTAWRMSDSGPAFLAAMREHALPLATGDDGVVIVDSSGSVHGLRRTLAAAAKSAGADRITATAVRGRLAGVALPTLDDARQTRRDAPSRAPAHSIELPQSPMPAAGTPNLQRDSIHPGTQPETKEPTMAAPANRPPALRVATNRKANAEPWVTSSGGIAGLSPAHLISAQRSYSSWTAAKPELGKKHDLANYVTYVQRQHADAPDAPKDSVTPQKSTKARTPATGLRDRYAEAQADYERQQADSRKGIGTHATTAHGKAYEQAWSRYAATSKRFGSPQGIIAAIVAGIVLHRAEKAYLRDRRVADIDKMITEARAAAPARPFPSAAEWLESQAKAGDPEAVKAVKNRDDRRDKEIAVLVETDFRAAALARLDDAAARVDRVLSGKPIRETDATITTDKLVGDAKVQAAEAQHRAEQSRGAAERQWAEKGSMLSLLFGGRVAQEYKVLDALARRDEQGARSLTALLPTRLEDCRIAAGKIAREGVAAVRKWEADPAVKEAERERERLAEVLTAVLADDHATTAAVLARDPAAASSAAARARLTPVASPGQEQEPEIMQGFRT